MGFLTRAIEFTIFSASMQHAAVDSPQKALISYATALAGGNLGFRMKERKFLLVLIFNVGVYTFFIVSVYTNRSNFHIQAHQRWVNRYCPGMKDYLRRSPLLSP